MDHTAVATRGDVFAEGHARKGWIIERGDGFFIEAIDVHKELPEARAEQIPPLAEEVVERGAVVFDAAAEMRHAERHRRRLRGDIQFTEEPREQRIRHVIEDHEPGVHRQFAARFAHCHRVRVAAGVIVLFEDREIVMPVQKVRAAESRDAGANDGDALPFHACGSRGVRRWRASS